MRARHPFSKKAQKDRSTYLEMTDGRPQLPLTRFTEKRIPVKLKIDQLSAQEIRDKGLRENIVQNGLKRMLRKVPRKED